MAKKGVREYYDDTAEKWAEKWYRDASMLPLLEGFQAKLPEHPRVLDLCCGAGYESMRMAALGAQVVGIDLSEKSIDIARKRNPKLAFHVGDMREDYRFIGAVDAVVCIAGLVHLPVQELRTAFERMDDVLRPDGLLLLVVRDGEGRLDAQSDVKVGGSCYDRAFFAHTIEELVRESSGLFTYEEEIGREEANPWRNYIFRKP